MAWIIALCLLVLFGLFVWSLMRVGSRADDHADALAERMNAKGTNE